MGGAEIKKRFPQNIKIKQAITSYGRYQNDRYYFVLGFNLLTGALYARIMHEMLIADAMYDLMRSRIDNDNVNGAYGAINGELRGW